MELLRTVLSSKLALFKVNNTFKFVSSAMTPTTPKILISTRIILEKKPNESREVENYKARLMEHGFWQRPEISFDKPSAPLFSIAAVHIVLALLKGLVGITMKYHHLTTFL